MRTYRAPPFGINGNEHGRLDLKESTGTHDYAIQLQHHPRRAMRDRSSKENAATLRLPHFALSLRFFPEISRLVEKLTAVKSIAFGFTFSTSQTS